MELSALQAELEKERQALENALTKAQLAEEKEQQNYKLLSQFKQLQVKYLLPLKVQKHVCLNTVSQMSASSLLTRN